MFSVCAPARKWSLNFWPGKIEMQFSSFADRFEGIGCKMADTGCQPGLWDGLLRLLICGPEIQASVRRLSFKARTPCVSPEAES